MAPLPISMTQTKLTYLWEARYYSNVMTRSARWGLGAGVARRAWDAEAPGAFLQISQTYEKKKPVSVWRCLLRGSRRALCTFQRWLTEFGSDAKEYVFILTKPFAQGYLLKLMHIFFIYFFCFELFLFVYHLLLLLKSRKSGVWERLPYSSTVPPPQLPATLFWVDVYPPHFIWSLCVFCVFGRCCATCDGSMLDVVSPNPPHLTPHPNASKTVSVLSVSCHPLFGRSFSTTGLRCRGRSSSSSSRTVVFVNVYVQKMK